MNMILPIVVIVMGAVFLFTMATICVGARCDQCHKFYITLRSTSKYKELFCTRQCEFINMSQHIADNFNIPLDEAKVELKRVSKHYIEDDIYKDCL